MTGRPSSPADRAAIMALLSSALHLDENALALNPSFQDWKYWAPHPVIDSSRSFLLQDQGAVMAHGGIWPIPLHAEAGCFMAFHLIDWAARRDTPGAGMRVLRECCNNMAAVFSIGGSEMTRKIVPAFGFAAYDTFTFLYKPLRPVEAALHGSARDWKMPARLIRNVAWSCGSRHRLPAGWQMEVVEPSAIPEALLPRGTADQAASVRSAALLEHVMACPAIRGSLCGLLRRDRQPVAYVLLVHAGSQARLVDYGPAGLDQETSRVLAISAELAARSAFRRASIITAATTEPAVRCGLVQSGFRLSHEEAVRVLKLNKEIGPIRRFRVTLLDSDALCL